MISPRSGLMIRLMMVSFMLINSNNNNFKKTWFRMNDDKFSLGPFEFEVSVEHLSQNFQ